MSNMVSLSPDFKNGKSNIDILSWLKSNLKITHNVDKLTNREMESLYYFSRGFTIKQAAVAMQLSPRTTEIYLKNIKTKLQVYVKSELIKLLM